MTWKEIDVISQNVARGLRVLDCCPFVGGDGEKDRRFLCIWSKNRWEWFASMLGAWYVKTTSTGFYDTQGESQIDYICKQIELKTIIVEDKYI
jgi:long-subunit acyl-CoA synthetase (AMP-forming)